MIKIKSLALVASALFAATSVYAGGKACCTTQASNSGKMECSQTYAKLNLTPKQKAKLDAFQAQCQKEGCTKKSMDKFMQSAKGILSKDQYAQLQTECAHMHQAEKSKS